MRLQKEYNIETGDEELEEDSEIGRELDRVEEEMRSHVNDVDLLEDKLSPPKLELHSTLEYPVQKRIFGLPKPSDGSEDTEIDERVKAAKMEASSEKANNRYQKVVTPERVHDTID